MQGSCLSLDKENMATNKNQFNTIIMKRLFFGLLVAATGLGASAFTNAHRAGTFYTTTATLIGGQPAWNTSATPATCLPSASNPCRFNYSGSGAAPASVLTSELTSTSPGSLYTVTAYKN